ncbi:MAG: hypothetical protein AAF125_08120 [Chloroflexota bacterium]
MKLIVLTGLAVKAKALLTHDLASHFLSEGQRVAILDNANVREDVADLDVELVNMRGGCACCAVAGKLYGCADDLIQTADVAIMAADSQTHVDNLMVVLDNLMDGAKGPIAVLTVALVDERTTCCFPYVAETLEASVDLTLHAPFTIDAIISEAPFAVEESS